MQTPPDDLDAADLAAVLAVEWGLVRVDLAYSPVGFGGHHWTAAVADRPAWFVTATRPAPGLAAAFTTATLLAEAGLDFVVAPVRTELGAVAVPFHGWAVSVTPWRDGATDHAGHGPEAVDLVVALHGATNVVRGVARRDDLALEARAGLEAALTGRRGSGPGGPYTAAVSAAVHAAAPGLRDRLRAYDTAAAAVDRTADVVTHGELKPGNLLTTATGPALVDWDTTLLAPAERDLWRLPEDDLAAYTARTGRPVDPAVLALYRDRWDLTDVALYVTDLLRAPTRTEDTETAWTVLQRLLARRPGSTTAS